MPGTAASGSAATGAAVSGLGTPGPAVSGLRAPGPAVSGLGTPGAAASRLGPSGSAVTGAAASSRAVPNTAVAGSIVAGVAASRLGGGAGAVESGAVRPGVGAGPYRADDGGAARLLRSGDVRSAATMRDRVGRVLPVYQPLRRLLPDGGLRRGSAVAVGTATGGTSLLFALLGAASRQGEWCAMVGLPGVGVVSAVEFGVVPERLALVPYPGHQWGPVLAALLDGFGLVVVRPAGPVPVPLARRLMARARQRGAVLLVHGDWPGADVSLRCTDPVWEGLSAGRGRLRRRAVTVRAEGRGAAARSRSARLLLPAGRPGPDAVAPVPVDARSPAAEPAGTRPPRIGDDADAGAGGGEAVS